MHPDSDEDRMRRIEDALRFMMELEAFYELAQFLDGVDEEVPLPDLSAPKSTHPGTDALIAKNSSMVVTDANMDVSDAVLALGKFRLNK
jgi:hypothetical protein